MSEYLREEILKLVKDPAKIAKVETLSEEELKTVTTYSLTKEQGELLDQDSMLLSIRIIYYRRLIDWASEQADQAQEEICKFIESDSFVQYPDFLTNEAIMSAAKIEWMEDHSLTLDQLREFELEILGARIGESGEVEVLITHNQVHPAFDNISSYMNFSQREYSIPPELTIGLLKKNSTSSPRGNGNEIYVAMKAPYPAGSGKNAYIEVVIAKF